MVPGSRMKSSCPWTAIDVSDKTSSCVEIVKFVLTKSNKFIFNIMKWLTY